MDFFNIRVGILLDEPLSSRVPFVGLSDNIKFDLETESSFFGYRIDANRSDTRSSVQKTVPGPTISISRRKTRHNGFVQSRN
jgi:hypothetical protein